MRTFAACLIAPLPSFLKVLVLRHVFGWRIGRKVRIGFSLLMPRCAAIGDRTRIGHFNLIGRMRELELGEDVVIGHANIVLGGRKVSLGDGATIGRLNEINAILSPVVRGTPDPVLEIGRRAVITAWHKIDFTDAVRIGENAIIAGRVSNIWTHNRQDIGPVTVGANCYVGSGVQFVPGSSVGDSCVVGLGSVITKPMQETRMLVAGVPARSIRPLDEAGLRLVTFPTRTDLDGLADLAEANLP